MSAAAGVVPPVVDPYKNIENAFYFFSIGANYKDNYFFINSFYSRKCYEILLNNKELFTNVNQIDKFILNNYIDEDDICIVCCANYKQIRYEKCGHNVACLICFEKMNIKNDNGIFKCPLCKQDSFNVENTFVESFK